VEDLEVESTSPAAEITTEELPVLAVRETVIYPGALLPVTVGRPSSLSLVQSLGENRLIVVISQLDPRVEAPEPEDLWARSA
jgi:ATP-dependent Lon protease